MAVEVFTNRATTTVSSGGTGAPAPGTQETWTVASSSSFPAAAAGVSQFHVADQVALSEVIAVTSVSGTTLDGDEGRGGYDPGHSRDRVHDLPGRDGGGTEATPQHRLDKCHHPVRRDRERGN